MIRGALYSPDSKKAQFGGQELYETWRASEGTWLWLDIDQAPDDSVRSMLQEMFSIDELAIADAFRERHPPKMEEFENDVFVLARGLDAETTDINYKTIQISFFLGRNFLITYRFKRSLSIERIWDEAQAGSVDLAPGPVYLACKVLRVIVDRYAPILLNLEKRLEAMEDELFSARDDSLLEELVNYNTNLKKMRRTLTYHCNVFKELEHRPMITASRKNTHLVKDILEQFDRLKTLSDLYQELVVDLINGYLSLSAHRLNQIMKVLTIFTVIFLPLTLMVGVYGMNFEYMPELRWRYSYFVLLGVMISVVTVAFGFFRWKKWL